MATATPTTFDRIEAEGARRAWRRAVPPKYRPLTRPYRYKGLHGGRGGMKSHFFAEMLVQEHHETPGFRSVCVREVQNSLEQSVKRLIEDKINALGYADEFRVLNTHIESPGGGVIIFKGMRDYTAESIKSLEGFDRAWVEEAQALSQNSLTLLRPTIRKNRSEIWFSWNPRYETDPVDKFFRDGDPPPDSICVEVNYEDNPHFPEVLRREMEWDRQRDPDQFAHVWRGKHKKLSEARVFKNWVEEEFDTPAGVQFLLGGDWGFSTDPTVLIRAFFRDERTLCVDHEAWEVGCEIEDTPALFDSLLCGEKCAKPRKDCKRPEHGFARKWEITADSARPETISHMNKHGYPRVVGSKKGPNSVEEGVAFLQSYNIVVHPRCHRTINELTFYAYKIDKQTGVVLPILPDKKNHVIDSLRYSLEKTRRAAKLKGGAL